MTNSQNKKVRMTKLLLKKSLFEYLVEKPITELNVRMICNKAQINRSTFYLHYKSIDDMLNSIKEEEISHFEKYIESIISTENEYQVCVGCLRFLYKGIIIKHNKTEPTYTKTSLFLCEKRRFFMGRTEKGGKVF